MNMTFWIPSGRTVLGYGSTGGSVTVRLDSGPITFVATSGNLSSFDIGPDPLYGQFRVVMHFTLNPTSDTVGASINDGRTITCEQILASRPVMNGSDELQIYNDYGLVNVAFSNNVFTIYTLTFKEGPSEAP